MLRNHLNLPLYNESSFWRGARSYQPSPVGHDRCSHDRSLIGIKHSLQGSARDLNYPVQNNNNAEPRKLSRQMAQTLYEIDSKPLNYSAQCQGSYSSSDTDSQDQSRIPKYNSQILGTSTRSLIQQVSQTFVRPHPTPPVDTDIQYPTQTQPQSAKAASGHNRCLWANTKIRP